MSNRAQQSIDDGSMTTIWAVGDNGAVGVRHPGPCRRGGEAKEPHRLLPVNEQNDAGVALTFQSRDFAGPHRIHHRLNLSACMDRYSFL
jgi:hypothetical protein